MEFSQADRKEPATILFATIPFDYLADTSVEWAQKGVKGFMLAGIMRNWDSDVWLTDSGRIVGDGNPLFRQVKRMNEICAQNGIDRNFIKVAFYSHLPDWFDDDGWSQLCENFRQGAVFARDGLFRGLAIDIEYISEIYELSWKDYQRPGYPISQLREKARARGAQIVRSMLREYPSMEVLHIPHSPECYGKLAADLFSGMCMEMSDQNAPGGVHLLTEATYQNTDVDWLIRYGQGLDELVEDVLPESVLSYWRRKCSISFGLWPLGYYRKIFDDKGKFLGYSGKKEKFGDRVVGSSADKSENYGVEEFRRQFAVARMICKRYVWIYCHGSTFWHLNPEQMERYGGRTSDALPVIENLEDYFEVLAKGEIISDEKVKNITKNIREGDREDFLSSWGSPKEWNVIGPFDNSEGRGFSINYPPEKEIDLDAVFEGSGQDARWKRVRVSSTGFLDLRRVYRPPDFRCAYALCYANVPKTQDANLLLGSDDGAKIWVDGELVFELDVVRGAEPDDDKIPIKLPKGRVPFFLKVTNHQGTWGFYLRVTDEKGDPIEGLSWSATGGC